MSMRLKEWSFKGSCVCTISGESALVHRVGPHECCLSLAGGCLWCHNSCSAYKWDIWLQNPSDPGVILPLDKPVGVVGIKSFWKPLGCGTLSAPKAYGVNTISVMFTRLHQASSLDKRHLRVIMSDPSLVKLVKPFEHVWTNCFSYSPIETYWNNHGRFLISAKKISI